MNPEEADTLAGEYVLGTLTGEERAAFSRALERDPALRAVVADWERRLAPLQAGVAEVAPSPAVWRAIEAALPAAPATVPVLTAVRDEPAGLAPEVVGVSELDRLRRIAEETRRMRRSLLRWRMATAAFGALAAALAVAVALPRLAPRPPAGGEYVAVVNRGGDQPALIVRVDLAANTVSVRPVATETPPGRSLELWVIGEGKSPRSLGVLKADTVKLRAPEVFAGGVQPETAKFAVTVEPEGGSPTGGPTGPVVYSGALIRD
jgi:anti-sigma-K factor RskA